MIERLENIMKIVVDSDALIKLTKTGSKEAIVGLLEVSIPKKVYEETVTESKAALMQIRFRRT